MGRNELMLLALLATFMAPLNLCAQEQSEPEPSTELPAEAIVNTSAATFQVSVPMQLPIAVDSTGSVSVSDKTAITNYSDAPVKVTNVSINMKNGWALVDYNKDFKDTPVNSKMLGFKLNGIESTDEGFTFDSAAFPSLNAASGKGNLAFYDKLLLDYKARLPAQSEALNNEVLADVVITVDWENSTGPDIDDANPAGLYNDEGEKIATWKGLIDSEAIKVSGTSLVDATSVNGKLVIDESITEIAPKTFRRNKGITSVTIPDSVTSIGEYAYDGCTNLTSVKLPSGIKTIADYTFISCWSLTSVTIPDSVVSIGDYAFDNCNLTSIIIPDGVLSIGKGAFNGCDNPTSIIIPNSVLSIGNSAFSGCKKLTSVTLPDSITNIDAATFSDCKSLTSIIIPDSVTSIGGAAFSGCEKLTSITIPDSVTSIGEWAFSDCESLTSIVLPDTLTSIGDYAFQHCTQLTSIVLPDSVSSIGEWAFSDCYDLASVKLPSGIKTIATFTFSTCWSLTSITIPESVLSIEDYAFSECDSLGIVTIPASVQNIGDNAFQSVEGIIYEGEATGAPWGAQENFSSGLYDEDGTRISTWKELIDSNMIQVNGSMISSVQRYNLSGKLIISSDITEIGEYAFYYVTLQSIVIPESVTSIASNAFQKVPIEAIVNYSSAPGYPWGAYDSANPPEIPLPPIPVSLDEIPSNDLIQPSNPTESEGEDVIPPEENNQETELEKKPEENNSEGEGTNAGEIVEPLSPEDKQEEIPPELNNKEEDPVVKEDPDFGESLTESLENGGLINFMKNIGNNGGDKLV